MTEPHPPPADVAAIIAASPTVEDHFELGRRSGFTAFLRDRMRAHALTADYPWLDDEQAVEDRLKQLTVAMSTFAGAEVATAFLSDIVGRVEHAFQADPRLKRIACEIALHDATRNTVARMVRMSLVSPLRERIPPLASQVIDLVDAIAHRAGPDEWQVHAAFTLLASTWHRDAAHHNALLAVRDNLNTDTDTVVIAAGLIHISLLYETRLAPFAFALDDAMVAAGLYRPHAGRTVGSTLKRICDKLASELPQHAHLLDPSWVGLRNATLHGKIALSPGKSAQLVTKERPGDRVWTLNSTGAVLQQLEDLVAPFGAVPSALQVLGSRYTLRFHAQIEAGALEQFDAAAERARQWLAENPEDP